MNKKDILMVVLLFGLWLLWSPFDRLVIKPYFFPDAPDAERVEDRGPDELAPRPIEPMEPTVARPTDPTLSEPPVLLAPELATQPVTESVSTDEPIKEEQTVRIENERMEVVLSSHGGTVREVVLKEYRAENREDSPPVVLDFSSAPALEIEGLAGLSVRSHIDITPLADGTGVRFFKALAGGLSFERTVHLNESYVLQVSDRFINESDQPLQVPRYGLRSGPMHPLLGVTSTYGAMPVGIDSLAPAESVQHWSKKMAKWLKNSETPIIRKSLDTPVDWVAVKNKYFVQSMRPLDSAAENCLVTITRDGATRTPSAIWAALQFPEGVLAAGESFARETEYYVGPQKYDELAALGYHQDEIMELGWKVIRFFAVGMLWGMNHLYALLGSYGVAIMLLTLFIRVLFWPLTHRGTESMRRMQELSPLMKELNEKYKTDPQKKQQALMELYKEHKVNPLGGCLPMVVQIPVFIGLFYVLRTAIELRFSHFLWIADLSEPENLLADVLPIPLNILPILMAITMFFQQRLTPTPSSGDEKQQQMHQMMMKFMPIMMLVMLYKFAAGLALYWTTQNALMILQQTLYRRRVARRKAAAATP